MPLTKAEQERHRLQLRRMATMVVPGTPVWYYPTINSSERHAATVAEPARELGEGQWTVRLRDLDEAYVAKHPAKRTTIPAASLAAIELRDGAVVDDKVDWPALVSDLADRFHDIASIIGARTMLADPGRRSLTDVMREKFEKRAAVNERSIALLAFERCVTVLTSVGYKGASITSCTDDDITP